jgi:hypothetical protein
MLSGIVQNVFYAELKINSIMLCHYAVCRNAEYRGAWYKVL